MTASPTSRGPEAREWVLVPRGPTQEMINAGTASFSGDEHPDHDYDEDLARAYIAMIAASPPAPVTGTEGFERSLRGPGAWAFERNQRDPLLNRVGWVHCVARDRPLMPDDRVRNLRPLYYSEQSDPLIDEAAPSSQPSGVCGDVELERLSAKATGGPWSTTRGCITSETVRHSKRYDCDDEQPDRVTLAYCGDEYRARTSLPDGQQAGANAEFIVALVNAYRSGLLVPASLAPDLRGGEKQGASPMGTEPSPTVEPLRVSPADAASVSSRVPADTDWLDQPIMGELAFEGMKFGKGVPLRVVIKAAQRWRCDALKGFNQRVAERDHVVNAGLIPWEPGSLGGVDLTFESGLRVALPISENTATPLGGPWQAIQSAPKDGRTLLLYWPSDGFPAVGAWMKPHGDYVEHWCQGHRWTPGAPPTHWMPLPAPPSALGTEAGTAETERLGPKDEGPADLSATPAVPKGGANV